ncbi:hypothetical protein PV379_03430 [Streptomyces caniscabiei]|uniref:hypothetical protein n=1 Tax=Streptomyces caniscabiei TaxID=2746961 RepID=UPI0029B8BD28|nr:hypothetical protein [Streptomyces caniscabiei]MDX2776391.1 hypothetical protein [Streptomyces caniscabiei]
MMNARTINTILLGLAGLIVIGVVIVLIINRNTAQTPEMETVDSDIPSIRISNFSSYTNIDPDARATIEDDLNRYISDIVPESTATGVIREGSYHETDESGAKNIVFIVDFAEPKLTYKISIGQDPATGERSIYIICPTKDELIYPPFNCKDTFSEAIQ